MSTHETAEFVLITAQAELLLRNKGCLDGRLGVTFFARQHLPRSEDLHRFPIDRV